jgi:hypothetical protein
MVLKRQTDDLQAEAGGLVELFACFKYGAEDVALDILMRLREGEEPLDVLAAMKDVPVDGVQMEALETIFRARDQELELSELDEEMFPPMGIEYLVEFEDAAISPELWLDPDSSSSSSCQSSPKASDSPTSSQSSPPEQSSAGSPPFKTEIYKEEPTSD